MGGLFTTHRRCEGCIIADFGDGLRHCRSHPGYLQGGRKVLRSVVRGHVVDLMVVLCLWRVMVRLICDGFGSGIQICVQS